MIGASTRTAPLYPPTVTAPPKPLPVWRFLPAFVQNPLRSVPQGSYEDDYVWFSPRKGSKVVWLSSPALVDEVLQADAGVMYKSMVEKRTFGLSLAGSVLVTEGADWRWQRRALAPLFRPADLQAHIPMMTAAAEAQVERWKGAHGSVQPIGDDMTRATFEVILATMLVGGHKGETDVILQASENYLARVSWEMAFAILRLPPWVPHPATRQMRRSAKALRGAVADIVERRRSEGGNPADLLGRLLSARHPDTGEPMSNELVISNLLTLLEAGHETTAKALTWTLYLLARAPDWQQQIYEEVRMAAGNDPIAAGHLPRMPVTLRVIKEALRLYPSAPIIARDVTQDIRIADIGVPAGSQILIPIYAIHRHRKLWTDPDRFDPDRFLPEQEALRPRMQYMPFGGGPRVCIGQAFAIMEAQVLLATFVRAARFTWDGKHEPEPVSRVTLRPMGGMPLGVTMR